MALALFHKQCSKNVPGNMYLFLTEATNVYSVTVSGGEVTDIVMENVTTFKQIQADRVKRLMNGRRVKSSWTNYAHTIEFVCSKPSKELNELSTALDDDQPCGVIAVVMDNNGQAWLVGWHESDEDERPLYLESETADSGDVIGSSGGNHKYILSGTNDQIDLPLNDTLNQYILDSIEAETDVGFTP